jgi:hypothetical protein
MSELEHSYAAVRRRRWVNLAKGGVFLVVLTLAAVAWVIFAKEQSKDLVGSRFLQSIMFGVLLGSIMVIVAALNLPERKTWRGIFLVVWGLIALTSPAFGWLFLFPWGLLALLLPVVIWILITLSRTSLA